MATGGSLGWLTMAGILALLAQQGGSARPRRQHGHHHNGGHQLLHISDIMPDWPSNCKLGLEALFAYGDLQSEPVSFDWLLVFGRLGHRTDIAEHLSRLELPTETHELGYVYRHSLLNSYCKKLGESLVMVNDPVPVALQIFYTMIKLGRSHGRQDREKQLPEDFHAKVDSCVGFFDKLNEYNRVHSAVDMVEAAKRFDMENYHRKVSNEELCVNALHHVLGNPQLKPAMSAH